MPLISVAKIEAPAKKKVGGKLRWPEETILKAEAGRDYL